MRKLTLSAALCLGLAGVAQAGFIGNSVDVQYVWPNPGSVYADLGTITVTSAPQTVTFQPYFDVTVSGSHIIVDASNYGGTYSGSFNGEYLIDNSVATFPAVLVDRGGAVVRRATAPLDRGYPNPGWVEQDPQAILRSAQGAIDAAEWVGPYDDQKMGFNKVAKYYYYPGWWEGGPQISVYINAKKWAELPKEYQVVIEAACADGNTEMCARYDAKNPLALRQLLASGTQLRPFPKDVMEACYKAAMAYYAEISASNPEFKKVYDGMHMALPLPTRILLGISHFITYYGISGYKPVRAK